jgi:hypothetical protein
MYSVLTAQAGGSMIPEAVAMETAMVEAELAMPVTGMTDGTAPEPGSTVAPKVVVEC